MSNKVKVRSLVKRAWHSGGSIKKGEIGEVSEADANILLKAKHVEFVGEMPPRPKKPAKAKA